MIVVTKTHENPETFAVHLSDQKPEDGVAIQGRELLMRPEAVLSFAVEKVNQLLTPPAPATQPELDEAPAAPAPKKSKAPSAS